MLAVETSGSEATVALARESGLIEERQLATTGARHARTLVADADALLRDNGIQPAGIGGVAVSIGPGSFTGLRVGLVFAKTLAWIHGVPLIPVETMQAIAQRQGASADPIQVIIEAQRGEVFVADYEYDSDSGMWLRSGEIRIATPEQLPVSMAVTGPALVRLGAAFGDHRRVPAGEWQPRARTVAALAFRHLARGNTAAPQCLEPVYVRRSYAEE